MCHTRPGLDGIRGRTSARRRLVRYLSVAQYLLWCHSAVVAETRGPCVDGERGDVVRLPRLARPALAHHAWHLHPASVWNTHPHRITGPVSPGGLQPFDSTSPPLPSESLAGGRAPVDCGHCACHSAGMPDGAAKHAASMSALVDRHGYPPNMHHPQQGVNREGPSGFACL